MNTRFGASEIALWVNFLMGKTEDLSSILPTVGREKRLPKKLSTGLHSNNKI